MSSRFTTPNARGVKYAKLLAGLNILEFLQIGG